MDIVREIETRYKLSRTVLAFLAIILGIVIILFRELLAILVGLFLIFWGVYEGYKMATARTTSSIDNSIQTLALLTLRGS